jgi:hypothetical protein
VAILSSTATGARPWCTPGGDDGGVAGADPVADRSELEHVVLLKLLAALLELDLLVALLALDQQPAD